MTVWDTAWGTGSYSTRTTSRSSSDVGRILQHYYSVHRKVRKNIGTWMALLPDIPCTMMNIFVTAPTAPSRYRQFHSRTPSTQRVSPRANSHSILYSLPSTDNLPLVHCSHGWRASNRRFARCVNPSHVSRKWRRLPRSGPH